MVALLINQEFGAPDTVLTDSIKRYEIPQIIEFKDNIKIAATGKKVKQ